MVMDKNITEKQFILQLKSGNILAFNKIFEVYSSKLYVFAYGYLKSKEDTEGLVQDVFTKVWEKRTDLNPELSFKAYLFTIAFNQIKKHFRQKAQFRKFVNNELFVVSTVKTEDDIDYNSLKRHIFDILKIFPEKRRKVFVKSRFDGLTNKEIAEELGLSKKTVENHLNLAIKQIKARLEDGDLPIFLFYCMFLK